MTKAVAIRGRNGFLAHINLDWRSTMPSGVYGRRMKLTEEQKKERKAASAKKWAANNRKHLLEYQRKRYAENRERMVEQAKQYYAEHRERRKEYARRYAEEHREEIQEQRKKYFSNNRDKIRKKSKQRYDDNRDVINAKSRQHNKKYYRKNKQRIAAYKSQHFRDHREDYSKCRHKRRAIMRNAVVGDVGKIATWEAKWRGQKRVTCHWCRKRIKPQEAHVDHVVPISKGGPHALENLCVSCASCNHSKHAKLPEVWNASLTQPLLFV